MADAFVKLMVAPFADNLVNSGRHKGDFTVTCKNLVSWYEVTKRVEVNIVQKFMWGLYCTITYVGDHEGIVIICDGIPIDQHRVEWNDRILSTAHLMSASLGNGSHVLSRSHEAGNLTAWYSL